MKALERFFRRIAYLGTQWSVDGQTPAGLVGWRSRVEHIGIAFGWMAKGGPYDKRTLFQRTLSNSSARSHFCYAATGQFKACA